MSSLTHYGQNKTQDALFRGQALSAPATLYFALIVATKGRSDDNRSTLVAIGDTIVPAVDNGHMYRCTVGGVTGFGEPTWPVVAGNTVVDGAATWVEMTPDFLANTNLTEVNPSGTGYARVGVAASLANFSGTQGTGTTDPSNGTSGLISNNVVINFGAPIADWGLVAFGMTFDAPTGGNAWTFEPALEAKLVSDGDSSPSIPVAAFSQQLT